LSTELLVSARRLHMQIKASEHVRLTEHIFLRPSPRILLQVTYFFLLCSKKKTRIILLCTVQWTTVYGTDKISVVY
jgi:hypothetical protein